MLKEETWSVSIQRARSFFREQPDVTEENSNTFLYNSCRIALTELKPKGMGVLRARWMDTLQVSSFNIFITSHLFYRILQKKERCKTIDSAYSL